MDFRVTEDQAALREGIRSFCEGRIPFDTIVESAERPLDPALWTDLAELGKAGAYYDKCLAMD